MDSAVRVLNSYRGRDGIIRTVSYSCYLIAGLSNGRTRQILCKLGSELSSCRTVLRLFDDVLMLDYNLRYGLEKQERDSTVKWLCVVRNITDQLYYPVEHVAWTIEKFRGPDSTSLYKWQDFSMALWAFSLYLNMLKTVRSIFLLLRRKSYNGREMLELILSLVEYGADLCTAVHWFNASVLWSGKLSLWQVGLFGLTSSLIGFYKMFKYI